MVVKNEPIVSIFIKLPMRLFLDFLASFFLLIKNKSLLHFLGVLKAYISFIFMLPKLLFNKKKTKKNPIKINKRVIPLEYYFRGKKRFSDL